MSGRRAAAALFLLAFALAEARAQETPNRPTWREDRLGWYVVRPGDTLEEITRRFLGTTLFWEKNWALNPEIRDPHKLKIGTRLRIILDQKLPPRTAEIRQLSNRVDQKPQPNDWTRARRGDLLQERDGIRTFSDASAALRFDDGSSLQLTEDSLVFLRNLSKTGTGLLRQSVEVERGQADFEAPAARPKAPKVEVEIVLGGALVKPQATDKPAQARTRRAGAGGAQVMVYGGKSSLSAGGAEVALPQGTGSAVTEGGKPSPPEKLLPATRLTSPTAGASWDFANPPFAWEPVPGAVSYTLEVCRDAACTALVARRTGILATRWASDTALETGALFARITPVSRSGLDGYPSPTVAFSITSDRLDLEPPVLAVARQGAGEVTPDGKAVLGRGGALLPFATDDAAGVAEVRHRWNGGEWSRWSGGALTPPGPGTHRLEAQATDRLGRVSEVIEVDVESQDGGPAPPTVRRQVKSE